MRKRKASGKVALVLLGAVIVAGCDQAPQSRYVYRSLKDCSEEWGLAKCDPAEGYPQGWYFGPTMSGEGSHTTSSGSRIGWSGGQPQGSQHAVGTVSRGGFGAHGGGHSGG